MTKHSQMGQDGKAGGGAGSGLLSQGSVVRLVSGREGRVQTIRLLSTGLPVDHIQLKPDMEPVVLVLGGKNVEIKTPVYHPDEIACLTMTHTVQNDDESEGFSPMEKEAFDNEAAFGDEGDDGNPFQDLMDNLYEGEDDPSSW